MARLGERRMGRCSSARVTLDPCALRSRRPPDPRIPQVRALICVCFEQSALVSTDIDPFRVELLPTIVVVAPDGRVAASFAGAVGEERLIEAIEAAR